MRKIYTCFLGLLLCPISMMAQQLNENELLEKLRVTISDSLKADIYIDLHNITFISDLNKAESYALKILEHGRLASVPGIIRIGYLGLARCERKRKNYDKVFAYVNEALKVAALMGKNSLQATMVDNLQLLRDYLDADRISEVEPLLKKNLRFAHTHSDTAFHAKLMQTYGWYYLKLHQVDSALAKYDFALTYYKKVNNEQMVAETKYLIVTALLEARRTENVAEHLFDAIEIYTKRKSTGRLADCYGLLGQSYLISGNSQKGIENYQKSIELFSSVNNPIQAALAQVDLARCYLLKNDLLNAKTSAEKAQKVFDANNYEFGPAHLTTFWGQYHSARGDDDRAEASFAKANELAVGKKFNDIKIENDRYWAQHRYKTKKTKSADSLLISYASNINNSGQSSLALRSLEEAVRKNPSLDKDKIALLKILFTKGGPELLSTLRNGESSDFASAIEDFLAINPVSLADSAHEQKVIAVDNAKLIEMETMYKTRLKDDSLKLQQQSLLIEKTTSRRKDAYILGAGIVALLLAGGFLMQYRFRKRADKDRATIELLQHEIHHRIKNNLAIIRRLIEIAGKKGADKMSLQSLQTRVAAIEVLHKHLHGERITGKISMQKYIEELSQSIQTTFAAEKSVQIKVNTPIDITAGVAEKIGLIANELITNSIKYAFPGNKKATISIDAKSVDKMYEMIIADNGIGIAESQQKNFGMKLIAGLSNEINANFRFNNTNGTVFTLQFTDRKI